MLLYVHHGVMQSVILRVNDISLHELENHECRHVEETPEIKLLFPLSPISKHDISYLYLVADFRCSIL